VFINVIDKSSYVGEYFICSLIILTYRIELAFVSLCVLCLYFFVGAKKCAKGVVRHFLLLLTCLFCLTYFLLRNMMKVFIKNN